MLRIRNQPTGSTGDSASMGCGEDFGWGSKGMSRLRSNPCLPCRAFDEGGNVVVCQNILLRRLDARGEDCERGMYPDAWRASSWDGRIISSKSSTSCRKPMIKFRARVKVKLGFVNGLFSAARPKREPSRTGQDSGATTNTLQHRSRRGSTGVFLVLSSRALTEAM